MRLVIFSLSNPLLNLRAAFFPFLFFLSFLFFLPLCLQTADLLQDLRAAILTT